MSTAREVDTSIRNVTQGEPWVDDVIEATKAFLPEAVASVTTDDPESEEVKKAKQVRPLCHVVFLRCKQRGRAKGK